MDDTDAIKQLASCEASELTVLAGHL
eukprot:COSAG05_NODE_26133_length_190_cov_86.285714_1_plen_25_part_01